MWSVVTASYMEGMSKTILLLGGSRYALPVIKTAHDMDCKVITCDYLPDNIAHRYSDGYENVSIVDKDAVLKASERIKIDGIMSFACDPGVVTAAYVAEKMGLPYGGSYKSVSILQNKNLFRDFLSQHDFNVPKHWAGNSPEKAMEEITGFQFPVIVKPTDSAGSKGVTKVESIDDLKEAIQLAEMNSIEGGFIIEEYLESLGHPSDSDCFSIDGKLEFVSWSSQRFDKNCVNPFAPAGFTWETSISPDYREELRNELQRLLTLLDMKTSIYNIETRVAKNKKAYIMEVSPRGGGNRLAEMIKHVTGVDLIELSVKAAMGEKVGPFPEYGMDNGWAEVVIHSQKGGHFKKLKIADEVSHYIIERDIWVEENETIGEFTGANKAIGTLVFKFDDKELMERVMSNPSDYISVDVV